MTAITDCGAVYGPGPTHLHETGIGGNPYPYGECTWFVYQFFADTQQLTIPQNMGNATDWTANAHREQWAVDMTPTVGKIVSWSAAKYPTFGHVAVVIEVTDATHFKVIEMNFTFFADQDASQTGKIDCRDVSSLDGITGFLTPHGAQLGQGGDGTATLMASLTGAGQGIAASITQAGLYVQAGLMTAELRAASIAQVGGGLLLMGGGGALAAFTLAGRGDPRRGFSSARSRMPDLETEPAPMEAERAWTAAERAWMGQRAPEPVQAPTRGVGRSTSPTTRTTAPKAAPRGPSPAAALRGDIRSARAAKRAAGPNSKAWVDANVRLRIAEGKLAALKR